MVLYIQAKWNFYEAIQPFLALLLFNGHAVANSNVQYEQLNCSLNYCIWFTISCPSSMF